MSADADLGRWLRRTPRPVAVMCDEKRVEVAKHGRSWQELVRTVRALEPSKLTLLDGAGNVLRSKVLEEEESDDDAQTKATKLSSDLQQLARLIAEAYEKGNKQAEPLLSNAMTFIDRQAQQISKLSAEVERLNGRVHKLQAELIELTAAPVEGQEEGGALGGIVRGYLQAKAEQAAIAAAQQGASAKSNGKAATK